MLSVSDVVVIGSDAYYVDKAGFKPLHDFMTDSRDHDRSMQEKKETGQTGCSRKNIGTQKEKVKMTGGVFNEQHFNI